MKFGVRFSDLLGIKCEILLIFVQIWHFYCTMLRGLLFYRTQWRRTSTDKI